MMGWVLTFVLIGVKSGSGELLAGRSILTPNGREAPYV